MFDNVCKLPHFIKLFNWNDFVHSHWSKDCLPFWFKMWTLIQHNKIFCVCVCSSILMHFHQELLFCNHQKEISNVNFETFYLFNSRSISQEAFDLSTVTRILQHFLYIIWVFWCHIFIVDDLLRNMNYILMSYFLYQAS